MYHTAKILSYEPGPAGTEIKILIPGVSLLNFIVEKAVRMCGVWLEDGRHIEAEQRKKIYATVRDIAAYTGYMPEEQKEWLKYLHIARTGCQYFSFSDCSITTAREFINTMLEYAIENGVPLTDLLTDRTDDIGRAMYYCLKHRKCVICGRDGVVHHVDAIGRGFDRRKFDDSKKRKMCLCIKHHSECHTIGDMVFNKRYKVYGIIYKDIDQNTVNIEQPANQA